MSMLSMFGRGEEPKSIKPGAVPVVATRPANTNGPALRAPAPSARARLENPPSVGQYLVHLASDIRSFTRAEISGTVVGATPAEVQRLARLAAKLKGRYFAQALDLTSAEHGPISESDIRYLERARFMYEEVERALENLRHAIQIGDLSLEGLKRDRD
jgi:hypothetical protein